MRNASVGCGLAVVLLVGSGSAKAESFIASCAAALVPTEVSGSDNLAVQYAMLSSKLASSRDNSSAGGNITVPIYGVPVSLGYNQASEKRQELEERLGVNWDTRHSQAYMARYVSASSNSAFTNCVRDVLGANKPVLIEISDSGDNYVNIKVHIGTQAASRHNLELDLSSNGQFSHSVQRAWTIAGGVTTVVINRLNPGRDLHVTARVRSEGLELGSDEIVVPPAIRTVRRFTTAIRISPPSQANCGGVRGRINPGYGATVTVTAEPGETLDLGTIAYEEVGRINGRPDVALNPQQFHMEPGTQNGGSVSARAWCAIWANEGYSWTGRIRVSARVANDSVTVPRDNGTSLVEARAPAP